MMASVLEKRLSDGSKAYLVRFRTADGKARSKQFKRKREADAYVSFVEVDRMNGTLVDPRLGRMTVDEWWCEWWPTVTNLRISTRSRDAQFYRTHVKPVFGDRTRKRPFSSRLPSTGVPSSIVTPAAMAFGARAVLGDRLGAC